MKKVLSVLIAGIMILTMTFGMGISAYADESDIPSGMTGSMQPAESPVITDDVKEACDKAFEGLTGALYTPVALLGTQVVSGINYKVLCAKMPVVPNPVGTYAIVTIYKDLNGNAEVTDIEDTFCPSFLSPESLDGGWQLTDSPVMTDELNGYFNSAVKSLEGAKYEPIAVVAKQVLSGVQYCFITEQTLVVPGEPKDYAFVYIYTGFEGEVFDDGTRIIAVKDAQDNAKIKDAVKAATLKASATKTKTTVTLKWTKKGAKVDGYRIYRATSKNGKYKQIKKTSKLTYKDTKLKSGKTYYYKIKGYRTVGEETVYTKKVSITVKTK